MFSPWYARARRAGPADPLEHCALNVALYTPGGRHWTLTERRRRAIARERDALTLGSSALAWDGATLSITIDETTVPWPSRVRGRVRLTPTTMPGERFALDAAGRHLWQPIAPTARIDVAFDEPSLRWSGTAYLDANAGAVPLDEDFAGWTWTRMHIGERALVFYDVDARRGPHAALGLEFGPDGLARAIAAPPAMPLPDSRWRVPRTMRADAGHAPHVLRTLEDAPFYARSLVGARVLGQQVTAMHESLSLDRFRAAWVQRLLPFRMRREPA